jgi:glutamine synthetase
MLATKETSMDRQEKIAAVAELLQQNKIQFINLQFTDIMGVAKSVGIPVGQWDDVLDHGMWFDGSSVQGFARIAESDMLLHPDLDTFAVIPWDTDVPTARVICDVHLPTGEPFSGDPRQVLRRAVAEAASLGYEYFTGPELEFFLRPSPSAMGCMPPSCPSRWPVSTAVACTPTRACGATARTPSPTPLTNMA